MHLQQLSSELEEKIESEDDLKSMKDKAKRVIETKLIPDYREFRRQLESNKAGFWQNILLKSEKFFEIDAVPWTPKFYGEFFKAFGLTALNSMSANKEQLSNKHQALLLIKSIDITR